MTSPNPPSSHPVAYEEDDALLDASEALEEIHTDADADHPMDSDPEPDGVDPEPPDEEITLQNDSLAHFDPTMTLFSALRNTPSKGP